jgi:hypothetical protein
LLELSRKGKIVLIIKMQWKRKRFIISCDEEALGNKLLEAYFKSKGIHTNSTSNLHILIDGTGTFRSFQLLKSIEASKNHEKLKY